MQQHTTTQTTTTLTRGEYVWDALDRRVYRVARYDVSPGDRHHADVVLMDAAGRELPDYRHPTQVIPVGRLN